MNSVILQLRFQSSPALRLRSRFFADWDLRPFSAAAGRPKHRRFGPISALVRGFLTLNCADGVKESRPRREEAL